MEPSIPLLGLRVTQRVSCHLQGFQLCTGAPAHSWEERAAAVHPRNLAPFEGGRQEKVRLLRSHTWQSHLVLSQPSFLAKFLNPEPENGCRDTLLRLTARLPTDGCCCCQQPGDKEPFGTRTLPHHKGSHTERWGGSAGPLWESASAPQM